MFVFIVMFDIICGIFNSITAGPWLGRERSEHSRPILAKTSIKKLIITMSKFAWRCY